jgi:hypothetical protein
VPSGKLSAVATPLGGAPGAADAIVGGCAGVVNNSKPVVVSCRRLSQLAKRAMTDGGEEGAREDEGGRSSGLRMIFI